MQSTCTGLKRSLIERKSRRAIMEEVNALKLRNNLGEILDRLNSAGSPILISKGRKIRAVLVTPEDFERRFLDVKANEEKELFLKVVRSLRRKKKGNIESGEALRLLRGYKQ